MRRKVRVARRVSRREGARRLGKGEEVEEENSEDKE